MIRLIKKYRDRLKWRAFRNIVNGYVLGGDIGTPVNVIINGDGYIEHVYSKADMISFGGYCRQYSRNKVVDVFNKWMKRK